MLNLVNFYKDCLQALGILINYFLILVRLHYITHSSYANGNQLNVQLVSAWWMVMTHTNYAHFYLSNKYDSYWIQ
jgi:hypothetical protein